MTIHEFCKVKNRKFSSFKPQIYCMVYGSWEHMQKFSTISPKLCLLGQKTQGMGVDTTIVNSHLRLAYLEICQPVGGLTKISWDWQTSKYVSP